MVFIIMDIGQIIGVSDFVATLLGKVAKIIGCITFPLYLISKFILSIFINVTEKDNFTFGISLTLFLIAMLFQV